MAATLSPPWLAVACNSSSTSPSTACTSCINLSLLPSSFWGPMLFMIKTPDVILQALYVHRSWRCRPSLLSRDCSTSAQAGIGRLGEWIQDGNFGMPVARAAIRPEAEDRHDDGDHEIDTDPVEH